MTVRRIVANIAASDPEAAQDFYCRILGLETLMDQGWIRTMGAQELASVQISFASQGGSGTPVPDISIEVDDLDAVHALMTASGYDVSYGPVVEPWGVRRFYVRDPFGRLVNILTHMG